MNRARFPALAVPLGLLLHLLLWRSGASGEMDSLSLPLLTLLFVAEFGFVVTAIGAALGGSTLMEQGFKPLPALLVAVCVLLATGFALVGLRLWGLTA